MTGVGATTARSELVPVTPPQIADAAIEAARAGAAIAHIHVRDPETGGPSRDPALYREVVERIRASRTSTSSSTSPPAWAATSCSAAPRRRCRPIRRGHRHGRARPSGSRTSPSCCPEICTLDCGTMNFAEGDYVMTNTPSMLRAMARQMRELGVRPEIEVFDTGHLVFAKQLIAEGLIDDPVMIQLCMGIPYGAPDDPATLLALVQPAAARLRLLRVLDRPHAAAVRRDVALLAGGNVRVGLEDNIWLERGVKATNGGLVERAVDDPRGDERARARPRRGAREAGS